METRHIPSSSPRETDGDRKARHIPSSSPSETDGEDDDRTHAIILVTREGDSLRGGDATPSPQNPKPQNPFPRERVESRRVLNNKKIL